MKKSLLFLLLTLSLIKINAQCNTPQPPPGLSFMYALDVDNDGFAPFDLDWYVAESLRPRLENQYGSTSAGYDFTFSYQGTPVYSPYTNLTFNQSITIHYIYVGPEPAFQPVAPCFWGVSTGTVVGLGVVPWDGDWDNDGILNRDEDTNDNTNMMDDDEDGDGITNLFDPFLLAVNEHNALSINISPNPVENGIVNFNCNCEVTSVNAFDLSGKNVFQEVNPVNPVDLSMLSRGSYILKFESKKDLIVERIIIQ